MQFGAHVAGLGFDVPILFGGTVGSGQGSRPLATVKFIIEFLIFSRLLFVVDNFVAPIDDRQRVTAVPKIIPMMIRTMEISTSENPSSFRNSLHMVKLPMIKNKLQV
jgi:hypothetical protein